MSRFSDYYFEMDDFGQLSDEQANSLIEGDPEVDPTLATLLARLRSFAEPPVSPDLADRQVRMLAEAARFASPMPIRSVQGPDRGLRQTRSEDVFAAVRSRLADKAVAVGLITALLFGGVAAAATGNLPNPIQHTVAGLAAQVGLDLPSGPEEAAAGQATAAENQAFAEEMAANAERFAEEVQQTVGEYTTALDAWTGCVAENASSRSDTQSDPSTRTDEEFDPTEGCDEKPTLMVPDPADFGLSQPGAGENAGPPEGTPVGPPEGTPGGPPEGTPGGPPADLP